MAVGRGSQERQPGELMTFRRAQLMKTVGASSFLAVNVRVIGGK
jgi:hypothetical protein